jgi:predicted DNA-binding transcriptional regulator AlpA
VSPSIPETRPARGSSDLLTTEQLAVSCGLAASTLRKWRCQGKGPKFKRIGRAIRYDRQEVNAYLASRTFGSTALADEVTDVS